LILGVAHDCNFEDISIQEQPVACIVYRYTKTKRGAARGSDRSRETKRGRERQREAKSEGDAY